MAATKLAARQLNDILSAIASLTASANKRVRFTGSNTAELVADEDSGWLDITSPDTNITWDGTAPTSVSTGKYRYIVNNKSVSLWLHVNYTNAGASNTNGLILFSALTGCPAPFEPSGRAGSSPSDVMYAGFGRIGTSTSQLINNPNGVYFIKTGPSTYKISINTASKNAKAFELFLPYLAA